MTKLKHHEGRVKRIERLTATHGVAALLLLDDHGRPYHVQMVGQTDYLVLTQAGDWVSFWSTEDDPVGRRFTNHSLEGEPRAEESALPPSADPHATLDDFLAHYTALQKGDPAFLRRTIEAWEQWKTTGVLPNQEATPISELPITVRTLNLLQSKEVNTVAELCLLRELDLHRIPKLGVNSVNDIKFALARRGLSLKP